MPRAKKIVEQGDFDVLWDAYVPVCIPKGSKKKAKEKYDAAVKKGADPKQILEGTRRYIVDCHKRDCYTKNVVTFLNQEQWKDYLEQQDEITQFYNPFPFDEKMYKKFNSRLELEEALRDYYYDWESVNPWFQKQMRMIIFQRKNGKDEIVNKMTLELAKTIFRYKDSPQIQNSPLDPNFWAQHRCFMYNPEPSILFRIGWALADLGKIS